MRQGLDEYDQSMDEKLNALSHEEALREVAAWDLGHPSWSGWFIGKAKACGYTVEPNEVK